MDHNSLQNTYHTKFGLVWNLLLPLCWLNIEKQKVQWSEFHTQNDSLRIQFALSVPLAVDILRERDVGKTSPFWPQTVHTDDQM